MATPFSPFDRRTFMKWGVALPLLGRIAAQDPANHRLRLVNDSVRSDWPGHPVLSKALSPAHARAASRWKAR